MSGPGEDANGKMNGLFSDWAVRVWGIIPTTTDNSAREIMIRTNIAKKDTPNGADLDESDFPFAIFLHDLSIQ